MLLCGLLSARGWGTREVFVDGVAPVRLLGLVVSESPQSSEKPSLPLILGASSDALRLVLGTGREAGVERARTGWAGCPGDLGMDQSGPQLTL